MKNSSVNWGRVLVILLFLVGLPLGSWLFLQQGVAYRKASIAELKDLGSLPPLDCTDQKGRPLRTEDLQGKVSLLTRWPEDSTLHPALTERLDFIHHLFDEKQDLLLLTFLPPETPPDTWAQNLDITDPHQWRALSCQSTPTPLLDTLRKKPLQALLVDPELHLRRHYDIEKVEEIYRLVEHVEILLPEEKPRVETRPSPQR
ncbi:MAG: hypothetical protein D6765_00875 [Bacteroidetes bacterium]|nr:MAG: hypothetical protein D6765_00875 [Bacteroidota bacterium]